MADQDDLFQLQRIGHRRDIGAKIGHRPFHAVYPGVAVPGKINSHDLMRRCEHGQLRRPVAAIAVPAMNEDKRW